MPEERGIKILRFKKTDVLQLIIGNWPDLFSGKTLDDLKEYGNDPEDVNYVRFVFKEETVFTDEPPPIGPEYVPSDPPNTPVVPPWSPDNTPEE